MFGPQDNAQPQNDMQIPDAAVIAASQDWQHPGAPIDGSQQPMDPAPAADPAQLPPLDQPQQLAPAPAGPQDPNELLDIKQAALNELSPLVGHLEQSPEEKFRTTMMMIQASDDNSLIKVAFEAAQQIQDDKSRAQALLDVINEINYFTQQQ